MRLETDQEPLVLKFLSLNRNHWFQPPARALHVTFQGDYQKTGSCLSRKKQSVIGRLSQRAAIVPPNTAHSVKALTDEGRTLWIVDAHRDDGKRSVVRADEKLTAFLELERVTRESFRVCSVQ